jgi:hypothetical protein
MTTNGVSRNERIDAAATYNCRYQRGRERRRGLAMRRQSGQSACVAVGREQRRQERRAAAVSCFGERNAEPALDLLEIVELAWHDVYGDITPSDRVIEDMLLLSGGRLDGLVRAARLALMDWRDLRVAADARRDGV